MSSNNIDPATGMDMGAIAIHIEHNVPIAPREENLIYVGGNDSAGFVEQQQRDVTRKLYVSLMAKSIHEPWDADESYVMQQYTAYVNMYESAQRGEFSPAKNEAVIRAHLRAKSAVAPFVDLLNSVKDGIKARIADRDYGGALAIIDALAEIAKKEVELTDEGYAQLSSQAALIVNMSAPEKEEIDEQGS